jgi:hypothetical protein
MEIVLADLSYEPLRCILGGGFDWMLRGKGRRGSLVIENIITLWETWCDSLVYVKLGDPMPVLISQ